MKEICSVCDGDGKQPGGYSTDDLCERCKGSGLEETDEDIE